MNTNIKFKRVKAYRVLQEKLRNKALAKGVNLIAPDTIYLSNDTNFGRNVTVEPYVVIGKKVKIGNNSLIKSFSHIEETIIKNNVSVGPYARLRPGTILKTNTKIGICGQGPSDYPEISAFLVEKGIDTIIKTIGYFTYERAWLKFTKKEDNPDEF